MSRNTLIGRLFTPAGFAVALGLFLLPFLTFSCAGPATSGDELPFASDGELSARFTAVDLLLDNEPTIEIRQGGQVISIDASGTAQDPRVEQEPLPMTVRAPVIGAATGIVLGLLLAALIPAAAIRRSLVAIMALGAGGALAYVIYVAAPEYVEAEAGSEQLTALGVVLETTPAIGFWAIVGVLAAVLVLQLIPTPHSEPARALVTPVPLPSP